MLENLEALEKAGEGHLADILKECTGCKAAALYGQLAVNHLARLARAAAEGDCDDPKGCSTCQALADLEAEAKELLAQITSADSEEPAPEGAQAPQPERKSEKG